MVRQRITKDASLTTEAVFSVGSVQSGYKQVFGSIERIGIEESSFGTPACRYELRSRGIGLSPVFGIGSCRIMARKGLDCERRLHE
jgi:hypothetical protein